MDNFDNIIRMEKILNMALEAVRLKDKIALRNMSNEIDELIAYYESEAWLKDFEADEKGLFPANLKRGVLSEDAVYDLICDLEELNFSK